MDKNLILSRLDYRTFYKNLLPFLRENGKAEAMALCPFHDDNNPSLNVNLTTGLYHCFSCGSGGDVFRFYQELKNVDFKTSLAEIGRMVDNSPANGYSRVVATYEYKDAEGKTLYIKERIEPGRGGRSKEFIFKHLKDGEWVLGRGRELVLYNLPELAKTKYAIIVEGEGKVEAFREWGLVATCLDSGANSPWHDSYLPYFEGKEKVVILPDNDKPGREYGQKPANALHGKVGEVKVVGLPGLSESEDIIDWIKRGGTKDQLLELIKNAPVWTPELKNSILDTIDLNLSRNEFWQPIPLKNLPEGQDDICWLWKGYLAKGYCTLLSGLWKSGKTTLLCHLLKALSSGGVLGGEDVSKGKMLIISEENKGLWQRRYNSFSLNGEIDLISKPFKQKPKLKEWLQFVTFISNQTQEKAYDLIVLDSLASLWCVQNENDASQVIEAVTPLLQWCDLNVGLLLLHHFRKGDGQEAQASRGSGSLPSVVDIILEFRRFDYSQKEDTRRAIEAWSRFEETTSEVVLELRNDEYIAIGNKSKVNEDARLELLLNSLPYNTPSEGITPEKLKETLQGEYPQGIKSLKRDVETLYQRGLAGRSGKGRKGSPFLYWRKNTILDKLIPICPETNPISLDTQKQDSIPFLEDFEVVENA